MAITATVDRFEGDLAVLLVGDEETVVNVYRSDLPPGVEQGDVLRLEVSIDREATEKRREEVREKIELLKQRSETPDRSLPPQVDDSETPEWLEALGSGKKEVRPFTAHERKHERLGQPPRIWHVEVRYRQWDGPRLPWSEDFGKASGQVYSLDGGMPQRSCNEVEVAKLLRAVRPEAYWISGFAPSQIPDLWRPWVLGPAEAPGWLKELDQRLRSRVSTPQGGMPDVVAWDPDRGLESALFVECKGPKEKNKEAQEDWVAAAIEEGVPASSFAVAIRVFEVQH